MFDSLAHLISDTSQALGHPNREHLDPEDLTRAVFETLALYGLDSAHSETSRRSKSIPVNLNARETVLYNAENILLPSYLERKIGNEPTETWDWLPHIRRASLESARQAGRAFCSFQRVDEGWQVTVTYDPVGTEHRLWYYSDPIVPQTKDDPLPLPSRFGFMFTARSVINAVPMMLMRAANLPEEQRLTSNHLQAIDAAVGHANSVIEAYEPLWNKEKRSDLNARGRMRRPLVGGG
jgi:hypothetical protein